jgi:hypothetical protein
MKTLNDPQSIHEQLPKEGKTAVLFIMPGCPFCRAFQPVFTSFADNDKTGTGFLLVRLESMENPLWDTYEINVVPTVLLFEGDKLATRLDGRPGEGLAEGDLKGLPLSR